MTTSEKRIQRVLQAMKEANLSQMVISDSGAIFYLTGKWIHPGERMLVLLLKADGNHKLIVNELFPLSNLGVEIVSFRDTDSPVQLLAGLLDKNQPLGIDKQWPARFLIELMELNGASKYLNSSSLIDEIRQVKDAEEIAFMREASRLNDAAMVELQASLHEGITEKQAAEQLARIYEKLGAEGFSFDPIIAFGEHSSDPHHVTQDTPLKKGDTITLDIGCVKDSYCSDMTRTVFFGEPAEKQREVYNIVLEGNLAGIAAAKPGARFCDVDNAARSAIAAKGYGDRFLHRTGHSIGLECHEFGDVSSANTAVLKPGMIFSVEPGVYLEGEFGVRIEDLVLVTEDGCEPLNKADKSCKSI